ncbi:MAG: hypothetical protein EOP48_22235 [Sphingobacteriales bacterium]|nr:MAG: hypothetical protein EOP48_22235 [Sphingobacteriales bacterium]
METKFLANQIKRKATRAPLKKTIDLILENKKVANKEDFILELRKENIDLVFRRASSGQIYGLTHVDHNRRSVFNGSDLGKNYTAKSVLERFDTTSIVSARSSAPTNGIQSPAMTLLSGHKEKTKLFDSKVELLETLLDRPPFEPSGHPVTRKKRKKKHRSQTIK